MDYAELDLSDPQMARSLVMAVKKMAPGWNFVIFAEHEEKDVAAIITGCEPERAKAVVALLAPEILADGALEDIMDEANRLPEVN